MKTKSVPSMWLERDGGRLDCGPYMSGGLEANVLAVAKKVGFDRRGNSLYKRSPDGEEILKDVEEVKRIRTNGHFVTRTLRRKKKVVDDDISSNAAAYRAFRKSNAELGA
jgi:hypothetical protein